MNKHILFIILLTLPILSLAKGWNYSVEKDEMTGESSVYVSSSLSSSTKKMNFPYQRTKGWIGVGCKKGKQWAYFGFSTAPNLSNTTTEDGYNVINTRIKIGNKLEQIKLTQKWGSKFLHTSNYGGYAKYANAIDSDTLISNMKKANSVLLELDWHGHDSTYFKFSLKGSTKVLNKMQKECGYKVPILVNQKIEDFGKKKKQRKIEQERLIAEDKEREEEKVKQEKAELKGLKKLMRKLGETRSLSIEEMREIEKKEFILSAGLDQKILRHGTPIQKQKEKYCGYEIGTDRTIVENILQIKIPKSPLSECKVYSPTSTVCKYKGRNVLGNNRIEIEKKYGFNPKICSKKFPTSCVTYIFKNDKLNQMFGCDVFTDTEKKEKKLSEAEIWNRKIDMERARYKN